MDTVSAIKRIYHEDEKAHENWSGIVTRMPHERPVETETCGGREQCEYEYINTVFQKGEYYGVPKVEEHIGEDGVKKGDGH